MRIAVKRGKLRRRIPGQCSELVISMTNAIHTEYLADTLQILFINSSKAFSQTLRIAFFATGILTVVVTVAGTYIVAQKQRQTMIKL